jgi:Tfp pilus assembly protein PilF
VKLLAGDYPAAYEAFKKAVEQMPTFPASYRGLAVVYDHYGERAKAIDIVRQGLAIVPTDPSLNEVMRQLQALPGTP